MGSRRTACSPFRRRVSTGAWPFAPLVVDVEGDTLIRPVAAAMFFAGLRMDSTPVTVLDGDAIKLRSRPWACAPKNSPVAIGSVGTSIIAVHERRNSVWLQGAAGVCAVQLP